MNEMNKYIVNFLPSIIRGVYRFDDHIESLKNTSGKIEFIYNKINFLPKYLINYVREHLFEVNEENADSILNDRIRDIRIQGKDNKFNEYIRNYNFLNQPEHFLEKEFIRRIILYVLSNDGMEKLIPQKRIEPYTVDFAIEGDNKYVFEIDGFEKFKNPNALNSFIERQNYLTSQGWIIYRYTYKHIYENAKQKIKELYELFSRDKTLKGFLELDNLERILRLDFNNENHFLDPVDFVNLFYKIQDSVAFKIIEDDLNEDKEINIKDNFEKSIDEFPLVYFSLCDLYHFLDAVQKISEINFSLPKINLKTKYNENDYANITKPHNNIILKSYEDNTKNDIVFDTTLKYIEAKSNRLLKNEDIKFRTLSFEDIRNNLSYITESIFGYKEGTKDFQNRVLKKIFECENVLGIFPTGSGKSFCFWLSSLLKPGLAIIICPLRSLMRDQFQSLLNYGLSSVAFINSDIDKNEREQILLDIILGKVKLLYLAPERMRIEAFIEHLKSIQQHRTISYLVIDEAHCISEWGHDFRPSYLHIPFFYENLKQLNSNISLIALTATASEMVKADILKILNMSDEDVVSASDFDRINFSYQIIKVDERQQKEEMYDKVLSEYIPRALSSQEISELLESENNYQEKNMGLIYVIYADPHSKNSIYDGLSHYLYKTMNIVEHGYEQYHYNHYGTGRVRAFSSKAPSLCPKCYSYEIVRMRKNQIIDDYGKDLDEDDLDEQRGRMRCLNCDNNVNAIAPNNYSETTLQNQRDFKSGKFDVMVATKGFGMGIDKGSIRFVVHTSFSSSIEGWYQEAGRVGRDGERAHCVVIAEMPSKDCIKSLRESSIKQPSCNARGSCPYGRNSPCDYGKQHMFIKRSYPSVEADTMSAISNLNKVINLVINNEQIRITEYRNNSSRLELALYRLKILNVIKDFSVIYIRLNPTFTININQDIFNNRNINTIETIIKSSLMQHIGINANNYDSTLRKCLENYWNNLKLNNINHYEQNRGLFDLIINNLLILIDYTYDTILKMRYQMLYNLFDVISNTSLCRRPSILGYFNSQEASFENNYRCELCDICVPDLNFKFDTRKPSDKVIQETEINNVFERLIKEKVFDIEKLFDFLSHSKEYPRTWYQRASFILEGAPNNLAAIFFCRELCPEEEKLGYSKRLIETAKNDIDIKTLKKIYDTTKLNYKWDCLKILNDEYGKFNNPKGIEWLANEAKKLMTKYEINREIEEFILRFELYFICDYIKQRQIKQKIDAINKSIRELYYGRNN